MPPSSSRNRKHPSTFCSKPYNGHPAQARSQDGCLTCRLRQKKCDQPPHQAACGPCERLKIECLGYASKRPSWLTDQTGRDCKRAIRYYLTEHRKNEAPPLSLARFYQPFQWIPTMASPTSQASTLVSISSEPDTEAGQPSPVHFSPFSALSPAIARSITPSLSPSSSKTSNSPTDVMGSVVPNDILCSLDATYNLLGRLTLDESVEDGNDSLTLSGEEHIEFLESDETYIGPLSVTSRHFHLPSYFRVLHTWVQEVRPFQYRLAAIDLDVEDLATIAGSCTVAIEITQNLACLHTLSNSNFTDVSRQKLLLDVKQSHAREELIVSSRRDPHDTALALGAAFGLSFMLFKGGMGEWKPYLDVSNAWLSGLRESILRSTGNLPRSLVTLAEIGIWMDILASASLRQKPVHLEMYRDLLRLEWEQPSQICLANTMGCDNRTMFGIAEIAALDEWKNTELEHGRLDILTLIDRAKNINEKYFAMQVFGPHSNSTVSTHDLWEFDSPLPSFDGPIPRPENVIAAFRAGAEVYLNAVVSGSFPYAKNVADAVDQSIQCFQTIPASDADRSLIFPLCITACLVRNEEQKTYFRQRFVSLKGIEREGNCHQARLLVEEVWARREREDSGLPVEWSDVMKASGNVILLA